MKASVIHQYGGPEVIQYKEVQVPSINDGDVLIKVAATSFNPVDALIRSGLFQTGLKLKFPYILGLDVAGVVEKVGNSVNNFRVGDSVYAYLDRSRNGGAAEYVACEASEVAHAPKSIPLQDAAALPLVASTAWQGLFEHGNLQKGQRVLITAAAGGVGSVAVQLAKWKGAYVIGTASERSFDILRKLGIDELINYKSEAPERVLKESVDLIFNLSPAQSSEVNKLLMLLKPGGMLVSAAKAADNQEAERLGVRTIRMASKRNAQHLSEIAKLVDEGFVKPFITERIPVSKTAEAHKKQGQNNGKILLIPNRE
ncbi:NADP-dependent oxidoreductase [Bacillus sp. B15-48]|uniref:NADP-dependent oxidoreductase n=1 Tax=Bacillus sp. B15-48 TaxID=1548601 RepID=UPI00193FD058|nr:NADP-dependent oxidoreductase [Bacillus sp. B15-48]MBM4765040.1 zinc-binding dehydrogenase [Bacillus sp. B15-48]